MIQVNAGSAHIRVVAVYCLENGITMHSSSLIETGSDDTDIVTILQRRIQGLELKNRILLAQLSHMRLTNNRNHNLTESYRLEIYRHRRLWELVIQYLSSECECFYICSRRPKHTLATPVAGDRDADIAAMDALFQRSQVKCPLLLSTVTNARKYSHREIGR